MKKIISLTLLLILLIFIKNLSWAQTVYSILSGRNVTYTVFKNKIYAGKGTDIKNSWPLLVIAITATRAYVVAVHYTTTAKN